MSSEIQPGVPEAYISPVEPTDAAVNLQGISEGKIYFDSLSEADKNLVIQLLLSAQFPLLVPPQNLGETQQNSSAAGAIGSLASLSSIDKTRHDIIMGMLDGWLENIQKIADERKRAEERKTIESMSIAYHAYKHQASVEEDSNSPLFALGLVISGIGIQQSILPNPQFGQIEISPVVDMANKTLLPLAEDLRAQLGFIGAIWATGIQYFTMAEVASKQANQGEPVNSRTFAKKYAENIIGLINTPSFNSFLTAIVTRSIAKGEPLAKRELNAYTAMVKIVLLSSSLALLYQQAAGKMTGIEFAGCLSGEISFPEGSLEAKLVGMLRLELLHLSESERKTVIESLMAYFDSNPSLESLANPAKVFAGIYKTLPEGELAG